PEGVPEPVPQQPVRTTPFWQGVIFDFADNYYMGGAADIEFTVRMEVPRATFDKLDDAQLLNDLHETNHDYDRVEIVGKIKRLGADGEIVLTGVTFNGQILFRRH